MARMNRRDFLVQSAIAVAGVRAAFLPGSSAPTTVKTASGVLRGEAKDGVAIFRGVPFARPPVGPLRFQASQPVVSWSGVRDATQFADAAMQPDASKTAQSEDCLYLNVWTPQDPGSHPVFVWIHGGGFTGGRSFDPLFDGSSFAQQGIVCVTVAYRLGVFGFLDLESVLGSSYAGSANNALRDIMLALQWLQQNLSGFHGDPKRVTIGGESAGAKLTDILMGAPSAADLFQQVISESGGAERIWPEERAGDVASSFAAVWSETSGQPPLALKHAQATDIIKAQERFTRDSPVHFPLRPEIDRTLVPRSPLETIRRGNTRGKRLLIGTNRDESALFIGPHPTVDPGSHDLGNLDVTQFRLIEEEYRKVYPNMSEDLLRIRSLTAEEYWIPSLRAADAHVEGGGTAFVYRFDATEPSGRYAGLAFHSAELRYVWDRPDKREQSADTAALRKTIHTAWCAFIQGQVPQAAGLPTWPLYSKEKRPTMILNTQSRVEDAPFEAEFQAWSGLLLH